MKKSPYPSSIENWLGGLRRMRQDPSNGWKETRVDEFLGSMIADPAVAEEAERWRGTYRRYITHSGPDRLQQLERQEGLTSPEQAERAALNTLRMGVHASEDLASMGGRGGRNDRQEGYRDNLNAPLGRVAAAEALIGSQLEKLGTVQDSDAKARGWNTVVQMAVDAQIEYLSAATQAELR